MKLNKFISMAVCAATVAGGMSLTSCSDSFLDEDLITQRSTDWFKTEAGINDLAAGAYIMLRFDYQYEWGSSLNCLGTDEATYGNNGIAWDSYSAALSSTDNNVNNLWNSMYGVVEWGNMLIANVPQYLGESNPNYKTRLGEGYFFRGWAYFYLTQQVGGVPLKLTPSTGVQTYFTRNTEEECIAQVISDLTEAYNLLPDSPEAPGRLHRMAAAHYLAKALLFRASERCDAYNAATKKTDLENVIKYGKEVIAKHPLQPNFNELWANTDVANSAADKCQEVILAAQYDNVSTHRDRYGNQANLQFLTVYQNLPGLNRDISGGREFDRVRGTEYTQAVYDRVNDSRFWKTFVTTFGANNQKNCPVWGEDEINAGIAPDGVKAGDKRFNAGELGAKYIINEPGDTRFTAHMVSGARQSETALKNGKMVPEWCFVRYFAGDERNWNNATQQQGNNYHNQLQRGLGCAKFRDGSRETIASQFGNFDGILARSADDYLMIAEAYIRLDQASEALPFVNAVRKRAGYKAGEDRSAHIDGGAAYKNNPACTGKGGGYNAAGAVYWESNTYYESNNDMAETTASTENDMVLNSVADMYNNPVDKPIIDKLGLTTEKDKLIAYILNERTRELYGEFQRWPDLARTRTLEARFKAFNYSESRFPGQFVASKHSLRPLPQTFIDGVTNANGSALTGEEKSKMQNPGY